MAVTATKNCTKCGEEKPLEAFHRHPQQSDGRNPMCASCKNARSAGYYQRWDDAQRARHRARVLRTRYGITPEMLDALYEQQEGCCAICGVHKAKPAQAGKRSHRDTLHVDHDHADGRVRGLICFNCNALLGQAKDDPKVLIRALAYLAERGGDDLRQ